jgi:hypothetical protein
MIVTPDGSSAIRGIHCVDCLTTGPQSVSERVLHRIWSSSSSFNFQYLLVPLTSSNSCLRLLPGLPVPSSIFTSITCFYKAVLTQDVTNIVSLPSFILCTMFISSLTLCNTLALYHLHGYLSHHLFFVNLSLFCRTDCMSTLNWSWLYRPFLIYIVATCIHKLRQVYLNCIYLVTLFLHISTVI